MVLAVLTCGYIASYANITITLNSVPLRQAMMEIEKVSNLKFFYKSTLEGFDKKVTFTAKNETEKKVLNQLFKDSNLSYKLESSGIVVVFAKNNPMTKAEVESEPERAEQISISGKVVDKSNEPIIGATVRVKGSKVGVSTDIDGNFVLNSLKTGDVIEISSIGYTTTTINVKNNSSVNVVLKDNYKALGEVVVVGYGTQKKVNLTGAVSVIKSEEITGRPTSTAAAALQGADPSMNLTFGSGGPNASYAIDIRGVASINGGSPLILVDGVEMSLSRVNANDIESVSILKDASAAAIYGAKASSGVVLITTKTGKAGSLPKVTFDAKIGWKNPTASTDFVTSGFWSAYINDMFMKEHAGYGFTTYTDADYAELWMRMGQDTESAERPWSVVQNDKSYKYYANFDWYNHYFKTTRPMQDYNVSVTGGTDRVNYYVSGRAYREDGMIRQNNDKMTNYSLRSKINIKVTDWLKYGINASYYDSKYHYPGGDDLQYLFKGTALHSLAYIPSTNPDGTSVYANKYNYNGSVTVGNGINAMLNYGKHFNNEKNHEFMVKNDIEVKIMKDWVLDADYSYLFRNYEFEARRVPIPYSDIEGLTSYIDPATTSLGRNQYAQRETRITNQIYNVFSTYSPSFGNNNFKLMVGMNGEIYHQRSLKAVRLDLLSNDLSSFNLASGDVSELVEDVYNAHTQGFFGRFNYDYAGKYLVELSGRYDGSSRFSSNHRWGFFPSGSVGWRMSQENFMESVRKWLNNVKIRASIGSLGNQQVGYYDYIQTIDTSMKNAGVSLDGQTQLSYATESAPVAGDLTWEKVITYDLGLDLGFLNNRLNFTGDLYTRDTKDMLTNGLSLPSVYGASVPKSNCANMRTKGWEIAINWTDNVIFLEKNLKYSFGAGIGDYKSKITKFDNPNKLLSDYYEGMNLGEIWGYHVPGLFKSDEEAAAYTVDQSLVNSDIQAVGPSKGLHGGDMMYADLDGDNKISIGENTVANPGDRRVIGNTLPRYNYNFRVSGEWNGFDLSVFFQGVGKRDWYPSTEATTFWGPYSRPYQGFIEKGFLSRVWTEDNTEAYFPRWRGYEALGASNQLGPANDRYLQSIAYLRLKNLTAGYTLPVLKKYVSEIRVYFSGENLAYWSPFKKHCKSIDPETAASIKTGVNYGFAKSYTFGLSVTF
jgi:TonB-linked SusC/RagA family outer membrane protein